VTEKCELEENDESDVFFLPFALFLSESFLFDILQSPKISKMVQQGSTPVVPHGKVFARGRKMKGRDVSQGSARRRPIRECGERREVDHAHMIFFLSAGYGEQLGVVVEALGGDGGGEVADRF